MVILWDWKNNNWKKEKSQDNKPETKKEAKLKIPGGKLVEVGWESWTANSHSWEADHHFHHHSNHHFHRHHHFHQCHALQSSCTHAHHTYMKLWWCSLPPQVVETKESARSNFWDVVRLKLDLFQGILLEGMMIKIWWCRSVTEREYCEIFSYNLFIVGSRDIFILFIVTTPAITIRDLFY